MENDKAFKRIGDMLEHEKLFMASFTISGEGTKIVFTGDPYQIDTPYLDAQSNGSTFLIDRMKGQSLYAHVTLEKGERSLLAELASDLL